MRLSTMLLWLAGLLAIAALLATHDIDRVIEPVLALRFALLAVIAFHLVPFVLASEVAFGMLGITLYMETVEEA